MTSNPKRWKTQFACFECRKGYSKFLPHLRSAAESPDVFCPQCGSKMWRMGTSFEAPRQLDVKRWQAIEAERKGTHAPDDRSI